MAEHKFVHNIDWAKIVLLIVLTFLVLKGYTEVDDIVDIFEERNQLENERIQIERDKLEYEIKQVDVSRCNNIAPMWQGINITEIR